MKIHNFSNGILGNEFPEIAPFTTNDQVGLVISHSGNTLWWFSTNLKAIDVSDPNNMIELDSSSPFEGINTCKT